MSQKITFQSVEGHKGLRFYKHPTRKHGVAYDKNFFGQYQVNGKRVSVSFGWATDGWTPLKCSEYLRQFKENAKKGIKPRDMDEYYEIQREEAERIEEEKRQEEAENITFSTFFTDTYYPIAQTSKKETSFTKEKMFHDKWIAPVIGDIPMKSVKPYHIEDIKNSLIDAERKPRTIEYCLAIVRQVWNTARNHEMVTGDSPTRAVKSQKYDNKKLRFLTKDETDRLLAALKKRSIQTYEMALLCLYTGMRPKEIFNLRYMNLDFFNDFIVVKDSKTGTRYAYMTDKTKKMLKEKEKGIKDKSQLIFKDRKGNQVHWVSDVFDDVVEGLGLNKNIEDSREKVTFYTFRHTYASWLVENGTDIYVIRDLMGHSSVKTTERYAKVSPKTLKDAVNGLNEKL